MVRLPGLKRFVSVILVLVGGLADCLPLSIAVPVQQAGLVTTVSWSELCALVQIRTGIEVHSVVVSDSRAAVEELRSRFVDLAVVDPAWYLEKRQSLTPLLQARVAPRETVSVSLIVPTRSITYRIADLAGCSVALTRAGQGAAGYFVPLALLAEADVVCADPRRMVFAETFDSILKGVAFGILEAGAVPSHELESAVGRAYADFIRVIAVSEPLPHLLIVSRATDDPARYGAIVGAFLDLSDTAEGRRALMDAGYAEFSHPAAAGFGALERYLRIYQDTYGAPN